MFNGRDYKACWAMRDDGIVMVIYEDGDGGLIPVSAFTQEKGT